MARSTADRWTHVVVRVLLGGLFAIHGYQKVFMALHGPGLGGLARTAQLIGFRPGYFWAWVVTAVEFLGGIFVFVGFASRLAAAFITIEMIIAGLRVNLPRGFWWTRGGFEVPLVFAVLGILIVLRGAGPLSVDHIIRRARTRPTG